jgi:hypothetical protein
MASGCPVEILTRGSEKLAGRLDDNNRTREDVASNNAISEVVQKGWFKKESEYFFEYTYYWDTVEEMIEYIEADWGNSVIVPDNLLAETHRLVQAADKGVEIRIRRTMVIASYRKVAKQD